MAPPDPLSVPSQRPTSAASAPKKVADHPASPDTPQPGYTPKASADDERAASASHASQHTLASASLPNTEWRCMDAPGGPANHSNRTKLRRPSDPFEKLMWAPGGWLGRCSGTRAVVDCSPPARLSRSAKPASLLLGRRGDEHPEHLAQCAAAWRRVRVQGCKRRPAQPRLASPPRGLEACPQA